MAQQWLLRSGIGFLARTSSQASTVDMAPVSSGGFIPRQRLYQPLDIVTVSPRLMAFMKNRFCVWGMQH